jgi:HEAT repeat protein
MGRLLTAALALALAAPVGAQTAPNADVKAAVADGHAEWTVRVSPKLVRALGSTSTGVRAEALHAIGTLEVATPGGADLRPAIPALFDVLHTDADWRHRVMALNLLYAADDEAVMQALRDETTQPAPAAVQRLLLACLAEHYGVESLRNDRRAVALAQALIDHDRRRHGPDARSARIVAVR